MGGWPQAGWGGGVPEHTEPLTPPSPLGEREGELVRTFLHPGLQPHGGDVENLLDHLFGALPLPLVEQPAAQDAMGQYRHGQPLDTQTSPAHHTFVFSSHVRA